MIRWIVVTVVTVGVGFAGTVLALQSRGQYVRASQHATVSQTVNTTRILVEYNRPLARERELFGGVVRWGHPWNPGANEATTVAFDKDVRVSGEAVAAGRYSLWMIPGAETWTVILSRSADVYHSPYPEGQDALRFVVTPRQARHMEALSFYFPEIGPDSATLVLHWGSVVVPIPIEVERELRIRESGGA